MTDGPPIKRVSYIPFRNKIIELNNDKLDRLLDFKSEDETLEQALERAYAETDYDMNMRKDKMDYYIWITCHV